MAEAYQRTVFQNRKVTVERRHVQISKEGNYLRVDELRESELQSWCTRETVVDPARDGSSMRPTDVANDLAKRHASRSDQTSNDATTVSRVLLPAGQPPFSS